VVEVDVTRKRIALTMKLGAAPQRRDAAQANRYEAAGNGQRARAAPAPSGATAMASAFARLKA
jgi:uncharacterized protein